MILAFTSAEWISIIQATIQAIVGGLVVLIPIWFMHRNQQKKIDLVEKKVDTVQSSNQHQTEVVEATNKAVGEQMKVKAAQTKVIADKSGNSKDRDIAEMASKAANETEVDTADFSKNDK